MKQDSSKPITNMKIANIQALRGLAALLVFIAHTVGAETAYGGGERLLPDFLHMGVTGVDLFFLISGFVMVYVTAPVRGGGNHHGGSGIGASLIFLYRRAARIYPLYWVLTLLLIALYAGKKVLFGEDTPIDNYLSSFLLFPDTQFPIIPVGWTLIHEMYFYLVFSLFMLFHRRMLPVLLGCWGGMIMLGWMLGWHTSGAWGAVIFSALTFEFIAGALIAMLAINGLRPAPIWLLSLGGVALIVMFIPLGEKLYPASVISHWARTAIYTLPYGLVLYGAVTVEWDHQRIAPKWLIIMGDASYSLYLIHIPAFLVIGKLLSLIAGPGIVDNIFLIIVYLIGGITAALFTHRFVELPLIRLAKAHNPFSKG